MSTANIIGNAIFGLRNKSGGNYINPAVKESLVGLWKFDQNTNESPTRNIIKNTIKDKGGDLELLNFGYKLNSGYGKYIEDFSLFTLSNRFEYSEISNTKVTITAVLDNSTGIYHSVTEEDSALYWNTFKIKVSGSTDDVYIRYTTAKKSIRLYNGINTVVVPNDLSWHSFTASATNVSCNITLEFVPEYEGALVTDGKDDMIVSQKTVQEMLGGSNVCTVVSMIHQINLSADVNTSINNIRSESVDHVCARHLNTAYGKTGIFGYSKQLNTTSNPTLINNILGDKKDYIANGASVIDTTDKYFVQGYKYNDSLHELSEVAVYWTFIANKVLTTDEINQIIAYYKLDKYVTPQVIYAVKRQGLTNDTPAADWYLKDFSGNGHDMQLYNYAKKGNSGVGKYEEDFTSWSKTSSLNLTSSGFTIKSVNDFNNANWILWSYLNTSPKSFKIRVNGSPNNSLLIYRYQKDGSTIAENIVLNKDGVYELPASIYVQNGNGFRIDTMDKSDLEKYIGLSVEQIPDYEGALVSDGKDDYGHADNLPIFKDYTVAIDRAWTNDLVKAQCLTSKLNGDNFGSFSFELIENGFSSYSFGISNKGVITIDSNKKISYQSKYVYNGSPIISGNNVDGKDLFLFRNRDSYPYYAEAAIWSYILFPYSLSEFLLERQLKRYKLGTLYPGMIEWRPIFNSNVDIDKYYVVNKTTNKQLSIGDYFAITDTIELQVYLTDKEGQEITSLTINGKSFTPTFIDVRYLYNIENFGEVTGKKSPQKINITIDEYIRYEDIVQPYPAIINLKQDGKTITWGDKLKVGGDIVFVESANLLPELYTVSDTRYNGVTLYPNTIIKVEKSMVFDNARTYLKANEPSCILSPNRLRIPNSSYKILGYIPDLTGKGNHGKLNNFAYALNSGANGYTENYSVWRTANTNIVITDSKIKATGKLTSNFIAYTTASINKHKIKITGIPNGDSLRYSYILDGVGKDFYIIEDGVYDIPASDAFSSGSGFLISNLSSYDWSNITIEEIGEHEGSICFDGTDDHITIPTLAHGGKCVMMKVNSFETVNPIYEQRNPNIFSPTFCIFMNSGSIVYVDGNNGKTYIDGVLNSSITGNNLVNILHNITVTNENITTANSVSPKIGVLNTTNTSYADMAMYEFMLFPEIPSEDEIKKLNDVMGIEGGYIESPNYYWDAYGKKNTDTDRNLIADQVSKDVANALEVKNVAYNSESGYTDNNGLLLDGVDDHAVNTAIPAVTDFTVIAKRSTLDTNINSAFVTKGTSNTYNKAAFMLEFKSSASIQIGSFGILNNGQNIPDLITYMTPTDYNKAGISKGTAIDENGLIMGKYSNTHYWNGVFYKLMFYTKTIDQLSINMLKNLFERDELIDVTNPIFKKQ